MTDTIHACRPIGQAVRKQFAITVLYRLSTARFLVIPLGYNFFGGWRIATSASNVAVFFGELSVPAVYVVGMQEEW